jgi:hypothetical protein
VRSAASLAAVDRIVLHSAIAESEEDEADLVLGGLGLTSSFVERDEPVGFRYFTPMSPPGVNGVNSRMAQLEAEDDVALVFGFVEDGVRRVAADRIVFDPQQPRDVKPIAMQGLVSDEIIVVANESETMKLAGRVLPDLDSAAAAIRDQGVDTVVTKRGASGSEVRWWDNGEMKVEYIGAHATRTVWPLGAGDVFSAGLAWAWSRGAHPVDAARVGSAAAAHWTLYKTAPTPPELLGGADSETYVGPALPRPDRPARVYLAGPFFSTSELWLVDLLRRELRWTLGTEVFSPYHDVGVGDSDVAAKDLAGLSECTSVLALLDGADPGTVFEVGWAIRAGIPVVGFADRVDLEAMKMLIGSGVELHHDLSSAAYRAVWAAMGASVNPGWQS